MIDEQEIEDRIAKVLIHINTVHNMNGVIIEIIDIAQQSYEKGYDDGYSAGYSAGESDCPD